MPCQWQRAVSCAVVPSSNSYRCGPSPSVTGCEFSNAPVVGDTFRILESTWRCASLLFTVAGMEPVTNPISSGSEGDIVRMFNLTHTALAPVAEIAQERPPSLRAKLLQRCFGVFVLLLRLAYPLSVVVLMICFAWAVPSGHWTHRALLSAAGGVSLLDPCSVFA